MGILGNINGLSAIGNDRPQSLPCRQTVIAIRGNPARRYWVDHRAKHRQLKAKDPIGRALVEKHQRNDSPKPTLKPLTRGVWTG